MLLYAVTLNQVHVDRMLMSKVVTVTPKPTKVSTPVTICSGENL
jgi:hypothetical protein